MPDLHQPNIHAFIQSGGRSSRMGTDKAWLEINGRPMIEHVLAAAEPVAASLSIVINQANPNADRYRQLAEKWNARLIYDLHDHKGPLGGIHTALSVLNRDCKGAAASALILACDLPFLTTEFLSLLCQLHQGDDPQSAIRNPQLITVPTDQEGRLQPLAAIYDRACLPAIEEMLDGYQLKVDLLFRKVSTEIVGYEKFSALPEAENLFSNINSPIEHEQLKSEWQ